MPLKSLTVGTFASAAVVSGCLLFAPSAKALSLAPGDFLLNGQSSISGFSGVGDTDFDLNFTNVALGSSGGSLTGLGGTPVVKSLSLTRISPTSFTFSSGAVTDFISGLSLNGNAISVDLNPFTIDSVVNNSQSYTFLGNISALVRASDGTDAFASTTLGGANIGIGNSALITVETKEIPSPALLPGLIGVGVAAFRKRETDSEDSAA